MLEYQCSILWSKQNVSWVWVHLIPIADNEDLLNPSSKIQMFCLWYHVGGVFFFFFKFIFNSYVRKNHKQWNCWWVEIVKFAEMKILKSSYHSHYLHIQHFILGSPTDFVTPVFFKFFEREIKLKQEEKEINIQPERSSS